MKVIKIISCFVIIPGIFLVFLTGCAATCYNCDLKKSEKAVNVPCKFKIAEVNISVKNMGGKPFEFGKDRSQMANAVESNSKELYPDLFSDSTDAVPVFIEFESRESYSLISGVVITGLTLGTIPIPMKVSGEHRCEFYSLNDAGDKIKILPDAEFKTDFNCWFAFSILAIMAVPASKEGKRSSGLLKGDMTTDYFNCLPESIVDSMVNSLASPEAQKMLAKLSSSSSSAIVKADGVNKKSLKSHVLLVGLEKYEDTAWNDLPYGSKDAKDFANEFKKLKSNEGRIKILSDKEATSANVKNSLDKILLETGKDDLVIFWSGRACNGAGKATDIQFVCHDSKMRGKEEPISLKYLMETLKDKNPGRVVCILDLCSSDNINLDIKKYLDKLRSEKQIPKGCILIISVSPDRKAEKKNNLENGALTWCLLQGIRGKADGIQDLTPKDGKITLREIYNYLSYEMPVETALRIKQSKYATIITNPDDREIWKMEFEVRKK